MKNIGIIYNAGIPEAQELATTILKKLAVPGESWMSPAENLETLRERAAQTGLVITVGGDGTILRAAQVTAPSAIPVVGINMGRLGFMTELRVHEALEKLPLYFNGAHRVEERNMLQAEVFNALNNENLFVRDTQYDNDRFGTLTGFSGNPRTLQLGFRYIY